MPSKSNNSNRDDIILTVLAELKVLGVKVPKHKKFNQKVEISKFKSDQDTRCKIFGVHLGDQEWVSDGEFLIPKFLALSTAYLQKYSGKEIGLFRKAGNVARQKKLRVILELGGDLEDCEPNDVASLLKQWLRELPEPLIPLFVQDLLIRCLQLEPEESCVTACLLACLLLLPDHLHTLKHLLQFLFGIAVDSAKNKMDVYNLAVIMAPNVFSMQEPSEKNKNNLVKQHTSLMKFLIENCNKIGDIPFGVSLDKFYASSELDSSAELLDSTNKPKKKGKTGPVQDIFSGFKKLVGQNGTPNAKNNTPDPNLKTSRSRSLSKRKAGSEMQTLSAVNKKQARSLDDLDNPILNVTPKEKGMPPNNNAGGHVRRKSIGALLRRKDRKRLKSCKLSQEVLQSERKSPTCTKETKQKNTNLELPKDELFLSSKIDLQSKSIKKSVSDGQLPSNKPELSAQQVLFASSSEGCLPAKQHRTSRHNLRSQALSNSELGEATVLDAGSDRNEKVKRTSSRAKDTTLVKHLSEANADVKQNISHHGMMSQNNRKVGVRLNEAKRDIKTDIKQRECEDISIPRRRSPRLLSSNTLIVKRNASMSRDQVRKKSKNDASMILNAFQNDGVFNYDRTMLNLGMKRQEAFIAKCNRNNFTKNSSELEESESKNKEHFDYLTPKLRDRASVSSKSARISHNKRSTADQKCMKRRTRHGSLIRGRPNSVNNGLQSLHSNRIYNDSNVVLNSPTLDSASQEEMLKYETRIAESPVLQSLDLSLTTLFQNFTLFSPDNFAQINPNEKMCSEDNISILKQNVTPDKMKGRRNIARQAANKDAEKVNFTPIKVKKKQDVFLIAKDADNVTPLQKKRKRLSSKSESKIPPMKKRSNPKRVKSFSCDEMKPKISTCESTFDLKDKQKHKNALNLSITSLNCEKLKSPLNTSEQNMNISYGNLRMNDSCFKTPVNKPVSPESEVWMSGNAFLSILSPPHEEVFNKRESIAMILKNNTGHVQAKVDLYDKAKSVHSNSSKKKGSESANLLQTPSQQCYSARKVYNSRNLGSETRGSSAKSRIKFQKSPLPPPPKFTLTDLNTPSPKAMQPLKEVTNTTPRIEEINNVVSPKKFKKSISPTRCTKSPWQLRKATPKLKKGKRNSFSGTNAYKLSKRVSRSESSPACRRKVVMNE